MKNLLNLFFNNLTIQGNQTSIDMARAMHKDSSAMKTIAVMTMLFLPATFVSSLFGTNFFALQVSGSGSTTLHVSELWWIYVVSAVPLTLVVYLSWLWYSGLHLQTKSLPTLGGRNFELDVLQGPTALRRKGFGQHS